MTVSKSVLTFTTLVFVGLFGGGIYLYSQAGTIVKGFLERTATRTLGVPVTITSVHVDLPGKAAVVEGLVIGNPEGFDKPYLMQVGKIAASLGPITDTLITINTIEITGTDVNMEIKQDGSNIMALKERIKPRPAPSEKDEESEEGENVSEEDTSPTKEQMKVIISRLHVGAIGLHPSVSVAKGLNIQKDLEMPDIVLTDIGRKENGILAREAIAQVASVVVQNINTAAVNAGLSPENLLKSIAEEKLDDLKDGFKGLKDKFF